MLKLSTLFSGIDQSSSNESTSGNAGFESSSSHPDTDSHPHHHSDYVQNPAAQSSRHGPQLHGHHPTASVSRVELAKVDELSASAEISKQSLAAEAKLSKPLVVYIDGPFGAPTSQIFRAQHAVLIGTGIGVTPFASILQSIMHRYWQARNTCPKCHYNWTSDLSASVGLNLRKVNNIWYFFILKTQFKSKLQLLYLI